MGDPHVMNISAPIEGYIKSGETKIAYTEWGKAFRGQGATYLLAHATGFHSRIWDQIVRRLPDRHFVCADLRGHGRSTGDAPDNWRVFGEDIAALVSALELEDIIGVGHSLGAHAMIDACGMRNDRFKTLLLLDPVIYSPRAYGRAREAKGFFGDFAARRKREFASPQAFFDRIADRTPYSLFDRNVLADYCEHALVSNQNTYALACSPETEARIYGGNFSNTTIYDSVEAINCPVILVRAKMAENLANFDFSYSPTWPNLVNAFQDAEELHWFHLTHFIPMQAPDAVAELMLTLSSDTPACLTQAQI